MFSHEKLVVYQKTIAFVAWTQPVIEALPAKVAARDQLDRASTSIALNLAEGNVKFSTADRARYLQTAHGSTVESAACLDVLVARGLISEERAAAGKTGLEEIARMLAALLSRLGCRFDDSSAIREEPDDWAG
jgi:four helix bundle protein